MVRGALLEKVEFQQRSEGGKGVSQVDTREHGRDKTQSQGSSQTVEEPGTLRSDGRPMSQG